MQAPALSDDRYAAFRHRAFTLYFAARFLSTFGLQIISVSVGWQIYDLTRDPFDLGLVGLIQFLPALVLILFTGAAADRYGRRTIMLICEIVIGFSALALVYFAWRGLASPLPIFAVLLVIGISRAFFAPASQSLAPNLVPARDLPNAIAWNSTSWQTATIVGPVAGGLLYGLGATVPYLTASFFFAAAIVAIALVPPPLQRARGEGQSWKTLVAGFSYVRNQKIVLGAISLDMFAVLLGGAIALMPVFARDVLELGPTGPWPFARQPRHRRHRHGDLSRVTADPQACRARHVHCRRCIWRRNCGVRPVEIPAADHGCADRHGRFRHDFGLCPPEPGAVVDAG
jgi:MFS family permease